MQRAHEGLADIGFDMPDSIESVQVCRKSGLLPNPGVCDLDPRGSAVYTEYFEAGTAPTEVCTHHVLTTACSESGGAATEFCPEETKIQSAMMILPENETGATDDFIYAHPVPCPIHTAPVLPGTEEGMEGMGSGMESGPLGPGYVGPGYVSPESGSQSSPNSNFTPSYDTGYITPNYVGPGN